MIDPSHLTSSSELTTNHMSLDEYLSISKKMKEMLIKSNIKKEYDSFYLNLDALSRPKFTKRFIEGLTCDAIESQALPSIVIAQAALETGYGKHLKLKNNIFGIKGRGIKSRTKEYVNGRYITIYSEFQYFKTKKHAFDRHFEIIKRYGVKGHNYEDWINVIVLNGYATDPNYAKKLNYIIEKYQLYRLDNIQRLNLKLNQIDDDPISEIQERIREYNIFAK